jgi:hypothetical protein
MRADRLTAPQEVQPPPSPRKYWTRRGIAEWLVERLSEGLPTLVGIDHGFSFPLQYFEQHGLPLDWLSFLDDFQRHWPTDEDIYVDFVRDGSSGNGAARSGNPRWRRLTELRALALVGSLGAVGTGADQRVEVHTTERSIVGEGEWVRRRARAELNTPAGSRNDVNLRFGVYVCF